MTGLLAALDAARAFPIPAPPGTPPWLGVLFLAGGGVVLVLLVLQAVRVFRNDRDEDGDDRRGGGAA